MSIINLAGASARRRGFLSAIAAMTAFAAVPVAAQNQMDPVSQPAALIQSFDIATIEPLVREMTGDVQRITVFGREALRANFGGRVLVLAPNACGEGVGARCAGLFHFMFFPGALSLTDLNNYNGNAFIAHAANAADGSSIFIRYAFCDYGCTRGTVASGMINYLRAADGYMEALSAGAGRTEVSAKVVQGEGAGANDASARSVSFELPAGLAATHGLDGATVSRFSDWVAADLFTRQ